MAATALLIASRSISEKFRGVFSYLESGSYWRVFGRMENRKEVLLQGSLVFNSTIESGH